ncbi:MAG: dihydrofolate reductase [Flavobacteriales bacterium]|nr:dihydrofolate reductase [Flavobacteriales bacterium]
MDVVIIVAVAKDGGIGKDNDLMWHLPADMKFFRNQTWGHHVIMGRKNYESIPERFRPLPGRVNVVLTRNTHYEVPGGEVVHSLEDALELARNNGEQSAFVIGGGEVYRQALQQNLANKMYITHVEAQPEADTFFPKFAAFQWDAKVLEEHPADEKHAHRFTIVEYTRKN